MGVILLTLKRVWGRTTVLSCEEIHKAKASGSDYRHGFEKEFKFFDHIEDRPIERYADLFGAGANNYLAGLLSGDTGNAPTPVVYKRDEDGNLPVDEDGNPI